MVNICTGVYIGLYILVLIVVLLASILIITYYRYCILVVMKDRFD